MNIVQSRNSFLCIIYEGVTKSFRTESIKKYNIRLQQYTLIVKQYKVLWRQNSLD